MRKLKEMARDRIQQVLTIRQRYGPNHYETIGAMSATFNDKKIAKRAVLKRWNKDKFQESGEIKPEFAGWFKERMNEDKRRK